MTPIGDHHHESLPPAPLGRRIPPRARRDIDAPLHRQVLLGIERLALDTALDDTSPLPTEAQLCEYFGVSRGTIRKATEELVRRGLLRAEVGRGTFVDKRAQVRSVVRARLTEVARPDSRFGTDVAQFVPDFDGSERCLARVGKLATWKHAATVFIAPDNSLIGLRRAALDAGKRVLVPTYGLARGIVTLDPDAIKAPDRHFASTLDGLEHFGTLLTLDALAAHVRVDMILTGATAVTRSGSHVGGGQAFLDLEWGLLAELDLVDASTPTVCVVHDCQVIDAPLAPGPFDITIDVIVTPSQTYNTACRWSRPSGIAFDRLDPHLCEDLAYLAELAERRSTPSLFERDSA